MAKSSPDLDPSIWSKLPDELLDYILCFLSLKSILNLRSTCKRFKSLLFNPSFLSKFYPSSSSSSSSSSPFSSFLLLSHPHFNHHFPLYNSVSATWRESSASPALLNPCPSSSSLLSSSNGLLCFHLPNSSAFLVSNLLSRSSTLVKSPRLPFTFELLTLISSPNGFKIFVYSSESVFLYDSTVRSWRNFGGFDSIWNDNIHQEGVYRDGYLYFITSHPYSVVSFDLEKGVWGNSFVEMPTNELIFARIVISDDCEDGAGGRKMYVIGGVGGNGISRCLKVWEYEGQNDDNNNWVEVESLPDLMYRKLVSVCYHNYEHIYCFWHNGMICICCYSWPEILYYRVSRRTWHWLPKCPALPHKWSCGFRWFSFVPKLHASI